MDDIELSFSESVAVFTLAAPERRNALTPRMAESFMAAIDEVSANGDIGAAVVRGKGGHFCAGADRDALAQIGSDPAAPDKYHENGLIYEAFHRFGQIAVPTVAAVRGPAVGAGFNLMLAADLRVIAENARLIAGFSRIGLHPGGGHFVLSARTMGREATAATALFGQEIDGDRAKEIGLAWDSVDDEHVEERAFELASRAASDPELSRRCVRSFREEVGPPMIGWSMALEAERAAQMWSMRRKDLRERP